MIVLLTLSPDSKSIWMASITSIIQTSHYIFKFKCIWTPDEFFQQIYFFLFITKLHINFIAWSTISYSFLRLNWSIVSHWSNSSVLKFLQTCKGCSSFFLSKAAWIQLPGAVVLSLWRPLKPQTKPQGLGVGLMNPILFYHAILVVAFETIHGDQIKVVSDPYLFLVKSSLSMQLAAVWCSRYRR